MALRKTGIQVLGKLNQQSSKTFVRTVTAQKTKSNATHEYIQKEEAYNAHNYEPIPVVISRAKGADLWDVEGNHFLDYLAGYAAVNTGHCHPKILNTLVEQAKVLSHTSRAFHNDVLPVFAEYATKYFGYDKILPMNTGVEAGETAVKIARKWGYEVKKIPENEAVVLFPRRNFWGRTLSAVSTSNTPTAFKHFGPFMPGFNIIEYDNLVELEEALKNKNVCAFMMEPIQGEAGVIVPKENYLKEVRRLCTQYNVLWIADEIQTGLGRTGQLLAVDHESVRPDILIIGKGLAGGYVPVSAVLSNDNVMSVVTPGTHGSTFGGNPLGMRLAITTLQVLEEERLTENAAIQGKKFRDELTKTLPKEVIVDVRGKGLMNAIEINPKYGTAWDLCLKLKDFGLLCKPCHDTTLRFTPPLVINSKQIEQGVEMIYKGVKEMEKKQK